jgi:hypothetical protein
VQLHHPLREVRDRGGERFYARLGFEIRSRERFHDGGPFFNTHQGLGVTVGREPGPALRGMWGPWVQGFGLCSGGSRRRTLGATGAGGGRRPDGAYVANPHGNEVDVISEEDR